VSRIATLSAAAITLAAWAATVSHVGFVTATRPLQSPGWTIAAILYVVLISALVAGSLVYLSARYGYARRLLKHRPAIKAELAAFRDSAGPPVTILVPSYKEAQVVVWKTVLSAALQDYPRRSVVLLIDDPPMPATRTDAHALDDMRALPDAVERNLAAIRARLQAAAAAFERRIGGGLSAIEDEVRQLAVCCREVSAWFAQEARRYPIEDHTDAVFVDVTLLGPSRRYGEQAEELLRRLGSGTVDVDYLRREYRALASRFDVRISSFERKRYANLSHEPNKAMNLNTYIGLMGRRLCERSEGGRLLLEAATLGDREITFADSEYVVVLDADTIVHPEYVLKLAHCLSRPEQHRTAVIQTPYSAFPGSQRLLERIAGATTDIQYGIHQGFTYYGATFWVGANAIIRKAALHDILQVRHERGFPVPVFINDHTLIEDTESTVDLRQRHWQLHNYPERMAFSATPPDFGALLIQRRRWANGGLLIVPKLWQLLRGHGLRRVGVAEILLRLHYLASLAVANAALLLLLGLPFDERLASAWLPITAAPYYFFYAVDLRHAGYRRRDVLQVYALNLLLIPISLGGVVRSLHQACRNRRSAFGRTPKVAGRTAAPAGYVFAEATLLSACAIGGLMELNAGHLVNGLFAVLNAAFLAYAIVRFVGVWEACQDLRPLAAGTAHRAGTVLMALAPRRFVTPVLVILAHILSATTTEAETLIPPNESRRAPRAWSAPALRAAPTAVPQSGSAMRDRTYEPPHVF